MLKLKAQAAAFKALSIAAAVVLFAPVAYSALVLAARIVA